MATTGNGSEVTVAPLFGFRPVSFLEPIEARIETDGGGAFLIEMAGPGESEEIFQKPPHAPDTACNIADEFVSLRAQFMLEVTLEKLRQHAYGV